MQFWLFVRYFCQSVFCTPIIEESRPSADDATAKQLNASDLNSNVWLTQTFVRKYAVEYVVRNSQWCVCNFDMKQEANMNLNSFSYYGMQFDVFCSEWVSEYDFKLNIVEHYSWIKSKNFFPCAWKVLIFGLANHFLLSEKSLNLFLNGFLLNQ